ncbi:MAG: hypothetical protein K8R67_18095 [Desulfobacteraceae bacterium]|nr:hypothetical protein [Desulfobacteraceae bacterium]
MPGKQANVTRRGVINEKDAESILARLSSVIPVPRYSDYGIDFFCQEYSKETRTSHQVKSIYGIQIKPNLNEYVLGGFDKNKNWKQYELTWYRYLSIPYFLGIITNGGNDLSIFSLISLKCVFHKTSATPYMIKVESECNAEQPFKFKEPIANRTDKCEEWTCNLGLPIIQLNRTQLGNTQLIERCKGVLNKWISLDRINALFLSFGIDRVISYKNWMPNKVDLNDITFWDYWQTPLNKEVLHNISKIAGPCLALMNKNYEASTGEWMPGLKELHQWMKTNNLDDPLISTFEKQK